ncbi:hypothetical protein [Rhizobium sp. BK376]|uniref:hypothetical protein n=1 Tax=Rhizobium sp. BK376 TaxID=2512149 RepID=UPI001FE1F12D|nr:hypothetical protein [Rhizobium sp. BK376]
MDAVIGGQAIYFALLVIIRLSGRRTLGQMTPFDLVTILAISETTQQAILGDMTLRSFAKSILYLGTNPDTRRESSIYLSNSGLEGIDTHRADYIALDLQTHSRILLKQIRFGRIQPHNLSGFDSKLVGLEKFKLPWMMSDHDPVSDLRQPHGEELSS